MLASPDQDEQAFKTKSQRQAAGSRAQAGKLRREVHRIGVGRSRGRRYLVVEIARVPMSPALYNFTDVLLQAMVVLVPWQSNGPSGIIFVGLGIWGLIYRVNRVRVRNKLHLRAIQGVVDRIFHNAAPVAASVILIAGGAGLIAGAAFAPFAVAGSSTLLLVSGIYRTWGETLALIGTRDKSQPNQGVPD